VAFFHINLKRINKLVFYVNFFFFFFFFREYLDGVGCRFVD